MSIFINQPLRLDLTALDQDSKIDDLSSSVSVSVKLKSPKGVTTTEAASFETDGSDGKVYYDIAANTLSTYGEWSAQLLVTYAEGTYPSTIVKFEVEKGL